MTLTAPALLAPRRVPVPWRDEAAAERAIRALDAGLKARSGRLGVALARPPAHNLVAAARLLSACETAVRPEIRPFRHTAVRHCALMASALSPLRPRVANDNEPIGIVVQQLLCLAGKRLDWREIGPAVEVGRHAIERFVWRSGRSEVAAVHAAINQAAESADLLLLAHSQRALGRLAGGVAAVLLPAGHGAFLGHLRLLHGPAGRPLPVIEAQTWLHQCDLRDAQVEVWEILTSGLTAAEMLTHLPDALRWLRPAAQGDRRLAEGLTVIAAGRDPATELRSALACSHPLALARMRFGMACADIIAAERRQL